MIVKSEDRLPQFARWIEEFDGRENVFAVGGYVRDRLLDRACEDFDWVVEEPGGAKRLAEFLSERWPEEFSAPHALGRGYPIWQLQLRQADAEQTQVGSLEIADSQREMFPDEKSRQRITRFGDLAEDCRRRDFTANMLYLRIFDGELFDLSSTGLSDLQKGVLRCHPEVEAKQIFHDDPLRILRLFRFHCLFAWAIEERTLTAALSNRERLSLLSSERISGELRKIARDATLSKALALFDKYSLLSIIFPEAVPMQGCTQDTRYHSEGDVWQHTLKVIECAENYVFDSGVVAPEEREILLWSAFFHDIGKPLSQSIESDGRIRFLGHELHSERIARATMKRLIFPKALREEIALLARMHMRGSDVAQWESLKPARRLLRDMKGDYENLLRLIECDRRSSFDEQGNARTEGLSELRNKMKHVAAEKLNSVPKIFNGHQIMKELGLEAGPELGSVLKQLRQMEEEAFDSGKILNPETVLEDLRRYLAARGSRS